MAALSLGVGGVLNNQATYRYRTNAAGALVQIEYSTASNLSGSTTSTGVTSQAGDDNTAGETITGLTAKTTYYYSVLVDGVRAHSSPFPHFKTMPAPGDTTALRLVVGSCQSSGFETVIFQAIASLSPTPDLFLQGGDFGYPDTTTLATQRSNYTTQYGSRYLTWIVPNLNVAHTWDDHDYGATTAHNGDGDLSGKANSLQAFKEYRPTYPLVNGANGIWQRATFGLVDIFIIDTRYQREAFLGGVANVFERFPTTSGTTKTADTGSSGATLVLKAGDSPSAVDDAYKTHYAVVTTTSGTYYRRATGYVAATRTVTLSASVPNLTTTSTYFLKRASMLDMDGIASGQLDWLITGLNTSTATWKLIWTSVGWNPTGGTLADDQWGGWDRERCEQRYIMQECASVVNVLVASGDWHCGGIDSGANSLWPEITASPYNQSNAVIRGTYDKGTDSTGHMFGIIDLTLTKATLTVCDAAGTTTAAITPLEVNAPAGPAPEASPQISWLAA